MQTRVALQLLCVAGALCVSGSAWAQAGGPVEDVDTQVARRHYVTGREFYKAERYEEACNEFTIARRILKIAALDFNLARCEERLEHWLRAIEFYELYLAEATASEDITWVVERVRQLKERVTPTPMVDDKRRPIRIAALTLAAGTVALVGGGFGAYYSTWSEYESKQHSCAPDSCAAREHVERAEHIGYALWGIAGAVAITDVVLWAIDARRRHRPGMAATGVTW